MSVLYIVMPIAFLLAAVAVLGFMWAAREGQFDDLDTPSLRVVVEDDGSGTRKRSAASRGVTAQRQAAPKASKKSRRSTTSTTASRL